MVITWTYANKIAFHIPHYAWAEEKFVPADYEAFKRAILEIRTKVAIKEDRVFYERN